jgi:TRAP-type C4-dicarboxylate transport system permease large subunit
MPAALIISAVAEGTGEFSWFWGAFVPGAILLISIVLTWWLYRHFSKSGN